MMISPEAYYHDLKGKTPDELQTCIRGLKQQMGSLKNRMENPYNKSDLVCPSESTQLYWTREYLAMAKKALLEAGGEYHESAADRRAAAFLQKLPNLKKIQFAIGGYFGGNNVYHLEIENERLHLTGQHYPEDNPLPIDKSVITLEGHKEIRTAEELFGYLLEMHIEEWRTSYDTSRFGYFVCDGTQWELQFEYDKGLRPWISSGSNSYPYNFGELLKLFGEEDPDAEDEDEDSEEEDSKEYLYCQVTPEDINRSYSYISEIPDINPGDIVVIPYGADNKEIYGTVVSTGTFDEWTAPYPVEYLKQ